MVETETICNLCDDNRGSAEFYYIVDPVQNNPQYNFPATGTNSSIGLNTPGEVIEVDSMLKRIPDVLTDCIPPTPTYNYNNSNENNVNLEIVGLNYNNNVIPSNPIDSNVIETGGVGGIRNSETVINDPGQYLLPEYTRRPGAAKDLSNINWQAGFSGNVDNLYSNPQNLTYVIERMSLERGGLDSNQLIKNTWNNSTNQNRQGPLNLNGSHNIPTCLKTANMQPYPTSAPFGLRGPKKWEHFDDIDVVSAGISSPQYGNNNQLPFNVNAPLNNGGCNITSEVKNNYCNSEELTGNGQNDWSIYQPQGI